MSLLFFGVGLESESFEANVASVVVGEEEREEREEVLKGGSIKVY